MALKEREESDIMRYKKYYNLDVSDENNYDLVIDTTHLTIEQTVENILEYLKKYC